MNRRKPSETRAQTMRDKFGDSYFADLGRKGGDATKKRAEEDPETFREQGQRGGNRTKELYGTIHFKGAPKGQKSKREEAP